MIGDGVLLTVGFDDVLRFFQSIPGHGREEMMLDLVVQSAIPEVCEGVSANIARREHLLVQKVYPAIFVQNRHTFMVRRGNRTQVQTQKCSMDDKEQYRLPGVQLREQQAKVEQVVGD